LPTPEIPSINKDYYFILDGTLFHHLINDLIREYDSNEEDIAKHILDLLEILQQFNLVVIYLLCSDIKKSLTEARLSRNQSNPTDERIAFWEDRKRVDLYVLEKLTVESHVLNIDNGWDGIVEKIMSYLQL
jgi:hypothetical protein